MSDRYLQVEAGRVIFDIERLRAAYPELDLEPDLKADMLEGETDVQSVMTRIYKSMREDEALAEHAKALKSEINDRQKRLEDRASKKRKTLQSIVEATGQFKMTLPIATFSVQEGKERVIVDDVEELPQGFYRSEKKPLPQEIKKSLLAGEPVPGARIEWGDDYLTVRSR